LTRPGFVLLGNGDAGGGHLWIVWQLQQSHPDA